MLSSVELKIKLLNLLGIVAQCFGVENGVENTDEVVEEVVVGVLEILESGEEKEEEEEVNNNNGDGDGDAGDER